MLNKNILASLSMFAFAACSEASENNNASEEIASNAATATEISESVYAEAANSGDFKSYLKGEMSNLLYTEEKSPLSGHIFIDEAGDAIALKEFTGKAMLINFWASWCAPCRVEMPALSRLQKAVGNDNFEVVAINVDRGGLGDAKQALEDWGVEGLALYNDSTMKIAFDLAQGALPSSFVVDRDGNFRALYIGPLEWDAPEAIELFTALRDGKI
ncbi:TlpA disulfide reductase family protein [Kordiimonas sp. SCSIO 12610]|uniref:TlpA disulfide reductase family protein n=1 Tax=Kordiimonas sp. SCSIO 12610 TaxID=2829597 RepID=UPI00210A15DF|nr:TlpA disulfide reductase family protein [Kordiimonas sp. SCSIO 12610]UTW55144.1 TlpA family protein disulfide reductase [Kordiimonas sp. SCSIO 12610]